MVLAKLSCHFPVVLRSSLAWFWTVFRRLFLGLFGVVLVEFCGGLKGALDWACSAFGVVLRGSLGSVQVVLVGLQVILVGLGVIFKWLKGSLGWFLQ